METEFNNLNVKNYNKNNDITDNSQGDDKEQKDNDGVITKNNILYHSKTTVNSSETDAFIKDIKDLFMDNITTVNNEKLIVKHFDS